MSSDGERTLDTQGLLCPQPILDLAVEIKGMRPSEEITVISDDPAFSLDLRAWCSGTGHELLDLSENEGESEDGTHRLMVARVRKRAR